MKKIALSTLASAALLSGTAHAQSSVTLYGVMDAFGYYQSGGGQHVVALNSGGMHASRFGVTGKEDIGGGTSVIFALESGISAMTGQVIGAPGQLFTRQAYVGVQNAKYGTLKLGRVQDAGYYFASNFDALMVAPASSYAAFAAEQKRPFVANNTLDPGRLSNVIDYHSPSYRGLDFQYSYSFGTANTANSPSYQILGVNYVQGKVVLGYLYAHIMEGDGTTPATSAVNENDFGASYDFGPVKAYASLLTRKVRNFGSDLAWQAGLAVPVTAFSEFRIGGGKLYTGKANGSWDLTSFAVDYIYNISKTTSVYAWYKQVNNQGTARQTAFPPGGLAAPSAFGTDQRIAGLGFSHLF